jgi:hypothetical protein
MMSWGRGGSLRHSRLQIVLAVAAVGTAVALPVVLLSVGGGVSAHELADLSNAGYQIVVSASGNHGIEHAHLYADRILAISGVTAASPTLSIDIDAFSPTGSVTPVLAEGVIPDEFTPTLGPAESGLFPSPLPLGDPTDSLHYANGSYTGPETLKVLVSQPYAISEHLSVGDSLVLSPTDNRSQGQTYNVTGEFALLPTAIGPSAAFVVVVPLSNLQSLTGYGGSPAIVPDAADSIEVAVTGPIASSPSALAHVQNEIQALFDLYSVSSVSQEALQLQSAAGVLTGFYLALSSVGLAVGMMFLALVLLRRVEANRRSIGIQRALGIPGRSIAGEILWDGTTLAFLGAAVGVVAGYIVVEGLADWTTGNVQEAARLAIFDPLTLGGVVLLVVALSLLAGAVAVRTALRIEISEALR